MPASRRIARSVPSPFNRRGTMKLFPVIGLHHISCLAPSRTKRQPFRRKRASGPCSERLGMEAYSMARRSPLRVNTSSIASFSATAPFTRSNSGAQMRASAIASSQVSPSTFSPGTNLLVAVHTPSSARVSSISKIQVFGELLRSNFRARGRLLSSPLIYSAKPSTTSQPDVPWQRRNP